MKVRLILVVFITTLVVLLTSDVRGQDNIIVPAVTNLAIGSVEKVTAHAISLGDSLWVYIYQLKPEGGYIQVHFPAIDKKFTNRDRIDINMSFNINNDLKISEKMRAEMYTFANFDDYKTDLITKIQSREPEIIPNSLGKVLPESYIDHPLQNVPIHKLDNLPPQAIVSKSGLEYFAKIGIEPDKGAFHGARLDREINIPIAVVKNSDDTFSIIDGMHRATQAYVSEEKYITAFVDGGTGPTLKDVFEVVKDENQ